MQKITEPQSKKQNKPQKLPPPEHSDIRRIIAVMSGKGGVGKSSVTALLAASLAASGYRVGILDADITGPSIPKLLGMGGPAFPQPQVKEGKIIPPTGSSGIKIMSLNLLLPHEDDPVIWRGPLIGGAVKQFWTDVLWGELDYLIVDLPPGTGDAPLTVLQSLPLDGIIIVSSPQHLAVMVVKKAIKMARMLGVPIIGMVENMSGMLCPHCGKTMDIFGPSQAEAVSLETGLPLIGTLPLDPEISRLGDKGAIDQYAVNIFKSIPSLIENSVNKKERGDTI